LESWISAHAVGRIYKQLLGRFPVRELADAFQIPLLEADPEQVLSMTGKDLKVVLALIRKVPLGPRVRPGQRRAALGLRQSELPAPPGWVAAGQSTAYQFPQEVRSASGSVHVHAARQGTRSFRHLRPQATQGVDHGVRAELRADGTRYSDAQLGHTLCPVILIIVVGRDDLCLARSCSRGCGTRTAVVDDGPDPRE